MKLLHAGTAHQTAWPSAAAVSHWWWRVVLLHRSQTPTYTVQTHADLVVVGVFLYKHLNSKKNGT